jgi:maltooligosyltrehalose trehalohydrolase
MAADPPSLLPPLGASRDGDAVRFRLWTTEHARCAVRLYGEDGTERDEPMAPLGDGLFEARLTGLADGARYRFVLGDRAVGDPWARALPDGVHGAAALHSPAHRWQHERVTRPLAEHVIYELHVGTFTPAGTYAAAAARLGALVELGVTAIELMPVNSFAGRRGWGYDGVAHFAPHHAYGTPDELRALIDAAHGLGLAVFMDVVYNHFGPAGNVLHAYSPSYFTREVETGWGEAPDFRQPWMRRYVLDNVRMWLVDYRCDGLRLDAVHAIVDPSPRPILAEIAALAAAVAPGALLVAEDERNDPAIVRQTGFDAAWADDFHHALHVTLTGEQDGYYAGYQPGAATIARAIERGWLYDGQVFGPSGKPRGKPAGALPAAAFVYCLQNHDQVGNRAFGQRLSATIDREAYAAASMLLLFLPMTPLVWMGQEWAASTPFCYFTDHDAELGPKVSAGRRAEFGRFAAFADPAVRETIPDPQAEETFRASVLRWEERDAGDHAAVLSLYRELLRLRRSDPVLRRAGRDALTASVESGVLVARRWLGDEVRILLANLQPAAAPVPAALGDAEVVLASSRRVSDELAAGRGLPAWSAAIAARRGGPP